MAHNISRTKLDAIDRAARIAELKPYVVPGWTIDPIHARITAVPTILGARDRRETVLFRCDRDDCRRRVELDLRGAVEAGYGDRRPSEMVQLLRCGHWRGCALKELSQTNQAHGIPIVSLIAHPDVLVAVGCKRCRARLLLPPRKIIDRLKERGRGDGATGLHELPRRVRGPCRKCGSTTFEASIVWPPRRPE